MATVQEQIKPPEPPGPVTWMRQNLFNSWFDGILTIVGILIILFVVWSIGDWIITQANWAPVLDFPLLYLVGQYPRDQLWRVALTLWTTSFLFGMSWGNWGNLLRTFALALGIFLGAMALYPTQSESFTLYVRIALLINPLLIYLGYLLGKRSFITGRIVLILWLLSVALTSVLLSGLGGQNGLSPVLVSGLIGLIMLYLGYLIAGRLFESGRTLWVVIFSLVFALGVAFIVFQALRQIEATEILPGIGTTLWGGLLVTMLLAIVGIVVSFPFGVLLALGRRSDLPAIRIVCTAFIEIVRGVPLVTILFMFSIILALFLPAESRVDRLVRALIAMIFFSSAYMAENVRGGLQAIPPGQEEAAHALGLPNFHITLRIVLPQALRLVIPTIVGQFITLFKDTTLAIIVGIGEILFIGRSIINSNPEFVQHQMEVFFFIAVIFWIFSYVMSSSSRQLETQMGVGER